MAQFLIGYNIVLQKKLYMKEYGHCLVSSEISNSKKLWNSKFRTKSICSQREIFFRKQDIVTVTCKLTILNNAHDNFQNYLLRFFNVLETGGEKTRLCDLTSSSLICCFVTCKLLRIWSHNRVEFSYDTDF